MTPISYSAVVEYYGFKSNGRYATGRCPLCDYGNNSCTISPKEDTFLCRCHACQDPRLFSYMCNEVRANGANHANGANTIPVKVSSKDNRSQLKKNKALENSTGAEPPNSLAVETYLRARRVLPSTGIPESIRFRELLPDTEGNLRPAMVSKVTDWQGNFMGIHRTYLSLDGSS